MGLMLFIVAWFAPLIGATIVPSQPEVAALVAAFGPGIICHAGNTQPAPPTAPAHHHGHFCPLCPICAAHTQAVLLLPQPTPAPDRPAVLATEAFPWLPPAIGPPPFAVHHHTVSCPTAPDLKTDFAPPVARRGLSDFGSGD